MNLGLFNFKNDDVLLLSGSSRELNDLADKIETILDTPRLSLNIHHLCKVSTKHPAKLYASAIFNSSKTVNEFWWKCTLISVDLIRKAANKDKETSFDTNRVPLLITTSRHYNSDWWEQFS